MVELSRSVLVDVLGGLAYDELHALHPKAYFPFPDRHGRPIYVERTGLADADLLNALVDLDRLEGHHIMSMETDLANLYALASAAAGRVVTKQTTILDFKEMTLKLANANSRTYVKRMSAVDSANYPETLGRLLIINAPSFFSVAWAMVKGFLDPVTVEKISIHGGPAEWLPKLRELIDEDKTPVEYGGTLAIEGGLFPARCGAAAGGRAGGRAAQADVCSLPSASATPTLTLPSSLSPPSRARSRLQRATLSKVVTEAFPVAAGDVIRIKWHARPGGASLAPLPLRLRPRRALRPPPTRAVPPPPPHTSLAQTSSGTSRSSQTAAARALRPWRRQ